MGAQQKWLEDHPVWGKGSVFLDELILVEKRLLTASQDNLPETKRSLGGWPGRPSWCARGKGMSWRKAHTVPGRDKLDLLAMFSPSTWPVTERKLQTCGPTGKALRCPSQNRNPRLQRHPGPTLWGHLVGSQEASDVSPVHTAQTTTGAEESEGGQS